MRRGVGRFGRACICFVFFPPHDLRVLIGDTIYDFLGPKFVIWKEGRGGGYSSYAVSSHVGVSCYSSIGWVVETVELCMFSPFDDFIPFCWKSILREKLLFIVSLLNISLIGIMIYHWRFSFSQGSIVLRSLNLCSLLRVIPAIAVAVLADCRLD